MRKRGPPGPKNLRKEREGKRAFSRRAFGLKVLVGNYIMTRSLTVNELRPSPQAFYFGYLTGISDAPEGSACFPDALL